MCRGERCLLVTRKRRQSGRTLRRSCLRCIIDAMSPNGTTRRDANHVEKFAQTFFPSSLFPAVARYRLCRRRRLATKWRCSNINMKNRGDSQTLLGFVILVAEFTRLSSRLSVGTRRIFADTLASLLSVCVHILATRQCAIGHPRGTRTCVHCTTR